MAKKIDTNLLNEELKRFRTIMEYSFYTGDKSLDEADDEDNTDKPDDLEPVDNADVDKEADAVGDELGVNEPQDGEAPPDAEDADINIDDANTGTDVDVDAQTAPPEATPPPAEDPNDVEVDVTQIVKGSEEAKQAALDAANKTSELLNKFGELEQRVARMDKLSHKIDDIEKEIVKRNPTPVEKLEMQSLNSYPYSLKLSDYWAEKEGPYDVMDANKKKEYILTQDDIDYDYSAPEIKNSFNPPKDSDYTEEDI
jgi:hypothetical protein